ncbi:MAG: hypothetical protein LBK50_02395 [Candidatus Nomurabacteria bacterium]|nr:hypothetical protein [Candidatus Nomurabacteria bacterium]
MDKESNQINSNGRLDIDESNHRVNNLDEEARRPDFDVDQFVELLDDVVVLTNYDKLVEAGATKIDLSKIKDTVNPEVAANNLEVFEKNKTNLGDPEELVDKILEQKDSFDGPSAELKVMEKFNTDAQKIMDFYLEQEDVWYFLTGTLENLVAHGAKIDPDILIEKVIESDLAQDDGFDPDYDLDRFKKIGASDEQLKRLLSGLGHE